MFIMNFDGFENVREGECGGEKGRGNVNLVDLNRNFLDQYLGVFRYEIQLEI